MIHEELLERVVVDPAICTGKPCIEEVENKRAKLVEVVYVGTHERAPY